MDGCCQNKWNRTLLNFIINTCVYLRFKVSMAALKKISNCTISTDNRLESDPTNKVLILLWVRMKQSLEATNWSITGTDNGFIILSLVERLNSSLRYPLVYDLEVIYFRKAKHLLTKTLCSVCCVIWILLSKQDYTIKKHRFREQSDEQAYLSLPASAAVLMFSPQKSYAFLRPSELPTCCQRWGLPNHLLLLLAD